MDCDLQLRTNVLKIAADLPALYLFALRTAYVREQILGFDLSWQGTVLHCVSSDTHLNTSCRLSQNNAVPVENDIKVELS